MATTARDEIIAEWRAGLADAEGPLNVDSPRTAWLARLKLRLYRFLLSLYGDGRWNASDSAAECSRCEPVVVSEKALPFDGKPAKEESHICAVLQSVADASEAGLKPGPLASPSVRRKLAGIHCARTRTGKPEHIRQLTRILSLAAMLASIGGIFGVCLIVWMQRLLNLRPVNPTLVAQAAVLAFACFLSGAILYGVFGKVEGS